MRDEYYQDRYGKDKKEWNGNLGTEKYNNLDKKKCDSIGCDEGWIEEKISELEDSLGFKRLRWKLPVLL